MGITKNLKRQLSNITEKGGEGTADTESLTKSISETIIKEESFKRVLSDNFKFDVEQDLREIRFSSEIAED